MADEVSSSDESFTTDLLSCQSGLRGYQFEPRRKVTQHSSSEGESASPKEPSEDEAPPELANRLAEMDIKVWCTCGGCAVSNLKRQKECVCCQEKATSRKFAAPSNTDESICITNNGDFIQLCLSPVVLRNVLVGLNNVRGDRWTVNPPHNSGLRFSAYRQFTWWVHGKLGPGRRKVIPACAIHKIRRAFPKEPNEEYEGFHSGEETDD